jgi:hypothetical protein
VFARTASREGGRLAVWVAVAAGAIYGLGLARFLFELDPLRLSAFGTWPGALLLAALAVAGAAVLCIYTRRLDPTALPNTPWAPLALALPLFSLLSPDVNLLRSITLLGGALALLVLLLFVPSTDQSEPLGGAPSVLRAPDFARRNRPARSEPPRPRLRFLLSLALFLFLFLLYLRTLAPAVGQADTFEFQVGVARLGIAHGSGYPLLMLIGRLFTLLPVGGTLAFRANLTSAFFGALAAVGVERISRQLGASPLVALLAGLAFGVSPTLWSRAVEIEAYTLNAAFISAILYLAIDLSMRLPHNDPLGHPQLPFTNHQLPITNYQLRLCLLAFLFGLSLTNHLTTLVLAPACVAAVIVGARTNRQVSTTGPSSAKSSLTLASVLGPSSFVSLSFLLGLSIYFYLPLRWPAVNHGEALSLTGFLNIITGNEAKGAFQWRLPFQDPGRYAIVWSKIAGEYGWARLVLSFLGIVGLFRPLRRYGVISILTLAYLGYLYFALAFNVPDPDFSAFIIPLYLITSVLMALGVQWLINLPAHLPNKELITGLLIGAFCLLSLGSIWRSFPVVDHSENWSAQQLGELMLNQPLTHGAAILADSAKIAPLDYLQIAEGRRPDLDIIVLPDEASYRAALDERLAAGQVVYLGRYLPGLGSTYSLRSVGPLAEVSPMPFTSTSLAVQTALAQPKANGITLVGYALSGGTATLSPAAPDELDVTLAWQALATPSENLLVNLRLIDAAGQAAWRSAGSVPVSGLYPTNAWRAGEVITDFYRLPIDPSLAPGNYQLQVALLPPFAPAVDSDWTAVAPISILTPAQAPNPPHLIRDQFGGAWLFGYDVPEAIAPSSHLAVRLYWLRTGQATSVTAFGETHSLEAWPLGAVVPVVYHMTAPTDGGDFPLSVDSGVPARCGWLATSARACPLPSIRLSGQAAAEGAINYDNQIVLNRAGLETPIAQPGGGVKVNLDWQALRALSADYTVFVHLLGPDGLVHGQIDQWPVSGTHATSSWAPGERISDAYTVQLPADAPAGRYQVEIGLYLLASGERLPVLNADGVPINDRFLLPGLEVRLP